MSEKKKRSKKRSDVNSKRPPESFVLYLDSNLGNHIIANALRGAGHKVEIHDDHLPIDAPDEDWIRLCSERDWVAVTKDKNIRYRTAELETIMAYGARVFVIRAKNATGRDIAELLATYHPRLRRFAAKTPAPFVAGIDRSGSISTYER